MTTDYEKFSKYLTLERKIKREILKNFSHDDAINNSWSALMLVIKHGWSFDFDKTLDMLLEDGNLDYQNSFGWTALMIAVMSGKDRVVEKILAKGCDVNVKDVNYDCTALYYALTYKGTIVKRETVSTSVGSGFEKKSVTNIERIIDMLLEAGADVNNISNFCDSITTAIRIRDYDISFNVVKRLIECKVKIEPNSYSLLEICNLLTVHDKAIEIMKLLLSNGVDSNYEDLNGCIPLNSAVVLGSMQAINLLLEYKANVNLKNYSGSTVLMSACKNQKPNLEIIKMLLDKGVDVNAKDDRGYTALMYACMYSTAECVKLLLSRGADKSIVNHDRTNAFLLSRSNNEMCTPVRKLLMDSKDGKLTESTNWLWTWD